jgi:hypothetical protein
MPTQMDFLRAKVLAYKNTLDGRAASQKAGRVSTLIAEQFNAIVEEIKKALPEAASHMPPTITSITVPGSGKSDVTFLDLEMMLNQVVSVLDVLRAEQ